MTILAVLQARMSSTRLPGKVVLPIVGEPMLVRQLERIRRADRIDGIVVATSTDPSDDVIADLAREQGTGLVRGPLDDVLQRFVMAVEEFAPAVVVRLTADCPLASPVVIDAVIEEFGSADADYCSNTLTPTFPDGLDVEVVSARVLLDVAAISVDPDEREHVTLGVYRRPDRYRLASYQGRRDLSSLRWTVDTPADYAFARAVYEELYPGDPCFDIDDILSLLERRPELGRTTADEMRNAALAGLDTGAMHA